MTPTDAGGLITIILTSLVAGGAGYKLVEKILDLWSTSDARASSSWREYAEKMEVRLDAAEADVAELRQALDAERGTRIRAEEDCSQKVREMGKHIARLEKIIRDAGLSAPGDTPPGGIPATTRPRGE